jgi:non-specific serine/threonine protein kinase
LLLLDNFEHVLAAAPLVSDLLQAASALQILVTSRAALRLEGEHELPLEPLHTPEPGTSFHVGDARKWEAIQLFAERAATAQPGFLVTKDNAAEVAEICRRLDGLPLAIELAAARIKLLSPGTLLARLDQRLSLLTVNRRDAPVRQQTLEMAIAWSYDLLTGMEQTLLRALAVFADGWSLAAAESIGNALGLAQPMEALAALVEHNLVVRDDARSHPRFRMLETIHAFAWDRLTDLGEEARVREKQLQYFIQLAHDCDIERLDAQVEDRRSELMAESVNLREVITWALDHEPDAALALLAELGDFWFVGDLCVTGRTLLARALDAGSQQNSWARGRVLTSAAWLASAAADYPAAAAYAESAIRLAELLGDNDTGAHALLVQGSVAVAHGDVPNARAFHEAALDLFEAIGDAWGEMLCVTDMGIAETDWGNLQTAVTYFQRIHAIADRLDLHQSYHAHALLNLADVYRVQGNQEDALAAAREAIALSNGAANRMMVANPRFTLAKVLLEQTEFHEAVPLLIYYLDYAWEMGDRWSLTQALEASGIALRFAGQWERATYLMGTADALRTALPFPRCVAERESLQQHVDSLQSALGPTVFREAWEAGYDEPLERAVRSAMDCLAAVGQDATD